MRGWTRLHREQFNSWISKKPFCDGYAWSYLYSVANYKKGMVNFRNEYIEVERGQYLTSKLKLQKIFGWTYRHVENFLLALKNDENITYRTTNRYIVITIVNYDKYQGNGEESVEQTVEQVRNRLGTEQEQIRNEATQLIKDKKDKNDKKGDTLSSRCDLIINYLNEKTGRNYGLKNKSTIDLLRARFNEGRTPKDFQTVIDKKVKDWLTDDKMNTYLRPSTLFNRTKFENYLNEPEEDKFSKYLKKE